VSYVTPRTYSFKELLSVIIVNLSEVFLDFALLSFDPIAASIPL
jgi:hypothetical protein